MNEDILKFILDDLSKYDELKEKIDIVDNEEGNVVKIECS